MLTLLELLVYCAIVNGAQVWELWKVFVFLNSELIFALIKKRMFWCCVICKWIVGFQLYSRVTTQSIKNFHIVMQWHQHGLRCILQWNFCCWRSLQGRDHSKPKQLQLVSSDLWYWIKPRKDIGCVSTVNPAAPAGRVLPIPCPAPILWLDLPCSSGHSCKLWHQQEDSGCPIGVTRPCTVGKCFIALLTYPMISSHIFMQCIITIAAVHNKLILFQIYFLESEMCFFFSVFNNLFG